MAEINKYTCLIVDDERTAREKLTRYVSQDSRFSILAQAKNGSEAVTLIEQHQPDLVLLDIQMPGLSGFDVIRLIKTMPRAIVFTTAFDQYAVKAFEVSALDYLLKPISNDRLQQSLDKVVTQLEVENRLCQLDLLQQLPTIRYSKKLPVRKKDTVLLLDVNQILFFRSEHRLVMVYDKQGQQYWTNDSLILLLEKLDPECFMRIHRNSILSLKSSFELKSWNSGRLKVLLPHELELVVSREYTQELKTKLGLVND